MRPCVAFVVDGPPSAWIARAVRLAAAEAERTYVLLLADAPARRGTLPAAFRAYAAIDRRFLGGGGLDPLAPGELADLEPARVLEVEELERLGSVVRDLEADVVVDLTSRERVEPGHVQAELWALRHDGEPAVSPFAIFRAFAEAAPTCTTELVRRTADCDRVLYRTHSLVRRLSFQRTRSPIYWKTAALPARVLRQPRRELGDVVTRRLPAPSTRELVRLASRLARVVRVSLRERLATRPSWSIAWRTTAERTAESGGFVPTGVLDPPADAFYADPFVATHDGRHYLFYEAYRRRLGRAELVAGELGATLERPQTILSRPYHLSYPFVFQADSTHYLVPESAEDRRVQLYRATAFPWTWETDATLLDDVAAYDPTLIEHEGRQYLFVAIPEPGSDIDELHVYWADDLRGPYRPHPLNPVVSDVRSARPAGRIYRDRDVLVRPAQDGAGGYGSAVVLNEIVRLTPDEYEEVPRSRIAPAWDATALGTHTVDHDGSIEVLDVKTLQPRRRRRSAV